MWHAQRILVATDFSRTANDAVQVAYGLARRMGSEVELLHVVDPGPQPLTGYAILDEVLQGARNPDEVRERALAALGALDVEVGPPKGHCHVLEGHPVERVLGQRELLQADLLVLGARGLRSLRRFLLGSVSDRALRQPGPPLLLVNKRPPKGEYKKILVAVEYPDRSTPHLETALALAHQLRSEVVVLHVLPPAGYVSDPHHVELDPKTAPKRLERLVSSVDATIPAQLTVRRGDAASVIPSVARRLKADLVVLGAERGRDGWPGRVADRVARAGLPALLYVWPAAESDEEFPS